MAVLPMTLNAVVSYVGRRCSSDNEHKLSRDVPGTTPTNALKACLSRRRHETLRLPERRNA
jgi:hypothetical protein